MIFLYLLVFHTISVLIVDAKCARNAEQTPPDMDFQTLRLHGNEKLFVDKSLFIHELINTRDEAINMIISRPPKFGKTVNLQMLEKFFQIPNNQSEEELNRKLFLGGEVEVNGTIKTLKALKIAKHTETVNKYLGKSPVILLSFENCNFTDVYQLARTITEKVWEFSNLRGYPPENVTKTGTEDWYNEHIMDLGIHRLIRYMYARYNHKVILLIDGYDSSVHKACKLRRGDLEWYDEICHFIEDILTSLFDDRCLEQIVITGIMPLGLEWPIIYRDFTVLDKKFSSFFGFTEREVNNLLASFPSYESNKQDIINYYSGHDIGGEILYNTVSILECLNNNGSVRVHFDGLEMLHVLDYIPSESILIASIDRLICKGNFTKDNIKKGFYRYTLVNIRDAIPYFVYTGYLNGVPLKGLETREPRLECKCWIPNYETKVILQTKINNWIDDRLKLNRTQRDNVLGYLTQFKFDDFESLVEDILRRAEAEKLYNGSYHHYITMLEGFIVDNLNYERFHYLNSTYNEEREDIVLAKDSPKGYIAMIIRLHFVKQLDPATLTSMSVQGLQEISQIGYDLKFKEDARIQYILKLTMSFGSKNVFMKHLIEKRKPISSNASEWIDITNEHPHKPQQVSIR